VTPWSLLDPWLPVAHVWWLEPFLVEEIPTAVDINAIEADIKKQSNVDGTVIVVEGFARLEFDRLNRLETKLDAQRSIVAPAIPLVIAVGGWAISRSDPSIVFAAAAAVYLFLAHTLALRGGSAVRRFMIGYGLIRDSMDGGTDVRVRAAAHALAYAHANERYGFKLGNYIFAAQRSATIALALVGITVAMLLAGSASVT
jgi:hypothetical protein